MKDKTNVEYYATWRLMLLLELDFMIGLSIILGALLLTNDAEVESTKELLKNIGIALIFGSGVMIIFKYLLNLLLFTLTTIDKVAKESVKEILDDLDLEIYQETSDDMEDT